MGVITRIKDEMKKRGISQNKLAKTAQISQSGLSSILNESVSPKESTLQAIAAALNIPLSELMDDQRSVTSTDDWDPDDMAWADKADEATRLMARGMARMSPENRQKLLDVARALFAEDFDAEGNKR